MRAAALAPLLAGFFLSLLALAAPARGAEWRIEQLMERLREVKTVRATFVETRHLAMLNAPLTSSGTLLYSAPGRLEKHTLKPRVERLTLDRDRLTVQGGEQGRSRTIFLQQYPVVWAFVEGIRSTLAGDLPTLSRFYDLRLSGAQGGWQLALYPGEQAMQAVVKEIRIAGRGEHITAVEVFEANGDRSVMSITEAPS